MAVNFADAVSAYNKAVADIDGSGMRPRDGTQDSGFAELLKDAAEGVVETLQKSEAESLKAAAGKADVNEVIMAVSQADLTLQTAVAIRDRVIQAYQDILRMPI